MLKWLLSQNGGDGFDIDQMDSALTRDVAALLARAGVPTFHRTLPRLRSEVDRARRYHRPLTLALIGDARGAAVRSAAVVPSPLAPGSPLIPVLIAPVLSEVTRSIDVVTYASTLARCVVLMPEASGRQAADAVRRMAELCAARVHVPVDSRLATFPADGYTLDELIRTAMAPLGTVTPEANGMAMPVGGSVNA